MSRATRTEQSLIELNRNEHRSRRHGKRVQISDYELWKIDNGGLISESKGRFDGAEYERQLKHGVNG